ncbi:MAG TPA: hypothetical protein VG498_03990 [Terriglobales bacterium]|nr:hypothetical protein [Terriglobales bacterium]
MRPLRKLVVSALELLRRVGSQKNHRVQGSVILLIVGNRYEGLERLLRAKGYTVLLPSTPDQGVALCLHNRIAATLLDESTLEAENDWSLAQSLKAVSPTTPVLLIVSTGGGHGEMPLGVDCVVSDEEPRHILDALRDRAA